MIANPWRGEVEMILDKPYVLRPTFAALSNVEQQLGVGLIALARKLAEGAITLEELVVIIRECMLESPADIKAILVQGGLGSAVQAVGRMLAMVFGGCDETGA